MVAGHIIGSNLTGMKVAEDSGWTYFFFSFEYLRMPLFTVISGYVYSLRPAGNSTFLKFIQGKGRRLLLALLSVGTLHFLIQYFVPGTNNKLPLSDMWQIYILPY
jgi:fucose 4-O-acetylase-like acetyltransferase